MTYEFEAKTEREAIELAVSELGLEKDQFDVEILEIQKNSLFKKGYAKIRVHVDENLRNIPLRENTAAPEDDPGCNDNCPEPKQTSGEANERTHPEVIAEGVEKTRVFIENVVQKMGYDCKVLMLSADKKHFAYRVQSKDAAVLIGKKGKNLDSIQLLANVYAGTISCAYARISVDCESYRIRREELLVRMAYDTADKVRTTKRSRLMEPLNPYERRIIHTTLNSISDIETKSEGSGLYKQVRVLYKGF